MACDTCRNEQRISTLEKDSERNQKTHKEFYDKLEGLTVNDATNDVKAENILVALGRMEAQINELLAKPSKRWDGLIMAAITALVGLVLGYFVR